MEEMSAHSQHPAAAPTPEEAAIRYLQEAVARGEHWFLALLGAMGMWSRREEEVDGSRYRYLIGDEAFDWQALGRRLCSAVYGLLPEEEVDCFLTSGVPPVDVPAVDLKRLLGANKYQGYLNYLYGVVIERCLLLATAEEVKKEWQSQCYRGPSLPDEVCHRVYGTGYRELVYVFRREAPDVHYDLRDIAGRKEFTYFLFKHRVRTADGARLASDTKKGLEYWRQQSLTPYGPP